MTYKKYGKNHCIPHKIKESILKEILQKDFKKFANKFNDYEKVKVNLNKKILVSEKTAKDKRTKYEARIRRKKVNRKRTKPDYIQENILARDFKSTKPNQKWLTDVTEFSIPEDKRKLYLSPILDLYDNSIVEYELSFSNNNRLVFKMFDRAIKKHPGAKPIFHSDRGFQYTNRPFKTKIEKANMTQSMSRVGKCIDNGPMEGFFGILKSEMFYDKKFKSMDELIQKIHDYIKFYNEKRLQKRLECLAPIEYRNQALVS